MGSKEIRLNNREIDVIKNAAKRIFGDKSRVILFGSRVDKNKRGGDIDLYVIPENSDLIFEKKLKYLIELKKELGEQKIDVVIKKDGSSDIEKEAEKTGVEL